MEMKIGKTGRLLYRYMSYGHWVDTVAGRGFAAQRPSAFEDMFEGAGSVTINDGKAILGQSAFDMYFSVLCLTKAAESDEFSEMQMWSRYANHGKGVRVIIDLPFAQMCSRYCIADHVLYAKQLDNLTINTAASGFSPYKTTDFDLAEFLKYINCGFLQKESFLDLHPGLLGFLHAGFFVKGPSWAWEHEYRILSRNIERCGEVVKHIMAEKSCSKCGNIIESKTERWFFEFLKPFIVGVDFGPCVNRSDMIKDVESMKQRRPNLAYRVAMRHSSKREIAFVDYEELYGQITRRC